MIEELENLSKAIEALDAMEKLQQHRSLKYLEHRFGITSDLLIAKAHTELTVEILSEIEVASKNLKTAEERIEEINRRSALLVPKVPADQGYPA